MNDLANPNRRNLPEVLAGDLTKSERVFRTRSLTSGAPALSLASESQPPDVPQRNPGRAATNTLHHTTSETALCPHQDRTRGITDTARVHQRGGVDKDAGSRYSSMQDETLRQSKMMGEEYIDMNQEIDQGKSRLFLNGLDEDWGSDSSADAGAGRSSPSMRIRKQSVTTTATSVEARSVVGAGVERVVCASPTRSPDDQRAGMSHKGGESWVDLGPDMSNSEEDMSALGVSTKAPKCTDWANTQPAIPPNEDDEHDQLTFVNIPRRRSSLSHQVTTVILGETAHTARLSSTPPTLSQELASQLLLPSPQSPSCQFSSPYQPPKDWADFEAAGSPVVPTSPRQSNRKPEHALKATFQDQVRPVSPPTKGTARDALDTTQSHSKMHILTQVQSWLDSSGTPRPGFTVLANPSSPTGRTSLTSIRVPAEVLENLRISVGNFPDTMLRTSSLTVQTIRSYSRKLRRGGMNNERSFPRASDEVAFDALDSPPSAFAPALERQPSFGSLKLKKLSLRGRLNLTSRLTSSPTSPSLKEEDDFWREFDDRYPANTRSDTPPSRKSHSDVSACVAALRSIFPSGTDYLLDALYAHIIAYNYINSLCGGLPHHHQDDGGHQINHNQNYNQQRHLLLRARPSTKFAVPPGVTSRVDLELQDPDDPAVREYEDDHRVASGSGSGGGATSASAVVPKKAASLLGLGATNMGGKPVRPRPGNLGGRKARYRKTTPPAASFAGSLESETAMRDLCDAIVVNINQLVATDGALLRGGAKELEPTLLRALCEVVRCYEELS
ncbi:hypothetical protein VMCG_01967 [Cytospora schulzeri]|uniref:Uncharacterized protein n=1 Tax=Cytospora schulzeri TaxID=448051 RepID=A0A423X3H9_9PEZI|nr:hypothetical protein VMCG_01967 [Valsa malicola]